MVSHVSHSVHVPPKEHIFQRWARIVEDSPDVGGWSHMSHIQCMYLKEHIYTKVGQDS
jgi:hypothetical protein